MVENGAKAVVKMDDKITGRNKTDRFSHYCVIEENLQHMNNIKLHNYVKPGWIIGHRGYHAKYPENTLAAFQAAIEAGADMIELDVMLSRDRRVVVIHDDSVDRTTGGKGAVAGMTLTELKQLDAGGWFDPQFAGQRVPELGEVLDLVGGRIYVNIEIKSDAYEPHHPPDAIENQVVEMLRQRNLLDFSMISSFDDRVLEQISIMEAKPAIAFISQNPASAKTVRMCTRLNTFSWHPDQRVVTRSQVEQMHATGIRVFPYGVETLTEYTRLRDMKVDGVITNDPLQVLGWSRLKKAA